MHSPIVRTHLGMVAFTTLRMVFRYPANIVNVVLFPLTFVVVTVIFSTIVDDARFAASAGGQTTMVAYALLGLGISALAATALGMAGAAEGEIAWGTLAANLATPVSALSYMAGLCLASLAAGSLLAVLLSVAGAAAAAGVREPLPALLSIVLSLVLYFGLGLLIAGAALRYKRIGAVAGSLTTLVQFISGAFIPVRALPDWLVPVAYVLPPTWAIDAVRSNVLGLRPLVDPTLEIAVLGGMAALSVVLAIAVVNASVAHLRSCGGIEAY